MNINRAVTFARAVERKGIGSFPNGQAFFSFPYVRGQFEVRAQAIKSAPVPLLIRTEHAIIDPQKISLKASDTNEEATLTALIRANCPNFPGLLPVRQISLQALSPTSRFWLRWVQKDEWTDGGPEAILVKGDKLAYFKGIVPEENDFPDVLFAGQAVLPGEPFVGRSRDIAGQNQPELLRLFILSRGLNAEILELRTLVQVSQLGNFSVVL